MDSVQPKLKESGEIPHVDKPLQPEDKPVKPKEKMETDKNMNTKEKCFTSSQSTSSSSTSNGRHQHKPYDVRARSSNDFSTSQMQRSSHLEDVPPGEKRKVDNPKKVRSKSHSISSTSSEAVIDDLQQEDDNKKREREMWAMLAGQTAFKFQSYIFQRVLPKNLIKPHIFPRHVEDMETLIEKYSMTGKAERLEGAAEKWAELKSQWKWRKAHGLVLGTAKSAYLHISNPLEVMMKLDREKGDSLEDARRAYRNVLPPNLQEPGQEVVDVMCVIGLLTDKSSPPCP